MKPISMLPAIRFEITDGRGRKKNLRLPNSVQEIRCMVLATAIVFARHNKVPQTPAVLVQLTPNDVVDPHQPGKVFGGLAWAGEGRVIVQVTPDFSQTLTVVIHEYLHLLSLPSQTEWVVSTLAGKFKPEIAEIAGVLLTGYYSGAGHLAHAQPGMAYKPGDAYNQDQWRRVDVGWTKKHRRSCGAPAACNERPPRYGFYSPAAAATFGGEVWNTPAGGEVVVTGTDFNPLGHNYRFPDKKPVGMVAVKLRKLTAKDIANATASQ